MDDDDDEIGGPRVSHRVIALVVVAALVLPVMIGTGVVIYRALHPSPAPATERTDLPFIAGFGRVGFRVDDNPMVRCALLAATETSQEQGMQGMSNLDGYDAMVFAFAGDVTTSFINHFVPVALSIGWYDSTGRLVDHDVMAACPDGKNCPLYASKDPYRYALETPVGGLEAMGLTNAGSTLHLGGGCT
jgi:uncharacterized membrane protein (UPF0127 family)